jgi:dipeptidyl aminopeptidase/acylaminoacyl peptidase
MPSRFRIRSRRAVVGAAILSAPAHCIAQAPSAPPVPIIPIESLMARPSVTGVQISPDGSQVAVLETVGAHPAIVLYSRTLTTRREIHRDTLQSIGNVRWSGDGRWLLMLHDRGGDEGYHLWRIDPTISAAQQRPVDLTPFKGAAVDLLAVAHGSAAAVIESNHRDARVSDVYRMDLNTARLTRLARNPGDVTGWTIDYRLRISAATATRADGVLEVRVPTSGAQGWRVRYTAPVNERMTLLGSDPVTQTLLLRSNRAGGTERYYRLHPATGGLTPNGESSCVGFDAGTWHRTAHGEVLAESCVAQAARFVPVDSQLRALLVEPVATPAGALALMDTSRALELESASADGTILVLYTHAATDPGRYILIDRARHERRELFASRVAPPSTLLAPTRFAWFTARDGLRLSLLITRSPVAPEQRQPVVVVVHGGPWARDALAYSAETQFLANRGYAVLQVNFRGSTGFGKRTVDGAIGEFGGRMSDDLLDALSWAGDSAGVDVTRACILGGSYGGFAALIGMTRDAAHFRCGIDYAGPFDLETLIRAFPPSWQPFLPRSWYRFVGNPADSAARSQMSRVSPLALLDRAQGPLLVFQGANDPRVRTDHALRVVTAWRNRGLPATLLLAGNEGHSFNEESTTLAVHRAVEVFLARWLGGRVQSTVSPQIAGVLSTLQAAGDSAIAHLKP